MPLQYASMFVKVSYFDFTQVAKHEAAEEALKKQISDLHTALSTQHSEDAAATQQLAVQLTQLEQQLQVCLMHAQSRAPCHCCPSASVLGHSSPWRYEGSLVDEGIIMIVSQEAVTAGQLAEEEWKVEISEMQDKLEQEIATTTELVNMAAIEKTITEQRCFLS